MPRSQRRYTSTVDPPQLPDQLQDTSIASDQIADQATVGACVVVRSNLSELVADDILFEQVHFKHVQLGQTQFTLAQFFDVRLEACDLAGAIWEKPHFKRVEVIGCRLVGAKLLDADIENLLVHDSNCELATFWSSVLRAARFENCSLCEASFEGTSLAGVVFRNCDLTNVDLRGTNLRGTDFRGSNLEGMQVGAKELRGAIIDPTQAVHLARVLGVDVQPPDDQ